MSTFQQELSSITLADGDPTPLISTTDAPLPGKKGASTPTDEPTMQPQETEAKAAQPVTETTVQGNTVKLEDVPADHALPASVAPGNKSSDFLEQAARTPTREQQSTVVRSDIPIVNVCVASPTTPDAVESAAKKDQKPAPTCSVIPGASVSAAPLAAPHVVAPTAKRDQKLAPTYSAIHVASVYVTPLAAPSVTPPASPTITNGASPRGDSSASANTYQPDARAIEESNSATSISQNPARQSTADADNAPANATILPADVDAALRDALASVPAFPAISGQLLPVSNVSSPSIAVSVPESGYRKAKKPTAAEGTATDTASSVKLDASKGSPMPSKPPMQVAGTDLAVGSLALDIHSSVAPALDHSGADHIPDQAHSPAAAKGPADDAANAGLPTITSARLIQNVQEQGMRIGLHSSEFGAISIHTSTERGVTSSEITLGHAELAHTISSHLSEMPPVPGPGRAVSVRFETNSSTTTNSGGTSQQSSSERLIYAAGRYARPREHASQPWMETHPAHAARTQGETNARLDIRI